MRFAAIVTCLVLSTTLGTAWADRCIGPKDTNMFGVTVPAASDIIFCDDFDTYCHANGDAVPRVDWPGYPPVPDTTLCTGPTDEYEWHLKQNWSRPFASPPWGMGDLNTRMEGWDGNPGWMSPPYYAIDPGNDINPSGPRFGAGYMVWDLNKAVGSNSSPIVHKFPGSNAVNGTDGFPLVLRFWTNDGVGLSQTQQPAWNKPPVWPFYGELYLDTGQPVTDRAPTDYTMAALTIPQCVNEQVDFPIICQQVNYQGSKPATCPPLSTTVHNSMAFGWLAPLDTDPCSVDAGRQPTMNHAVTYDGLYWRELRSNLYPGSGAFNYGMQQAMFEMTIKTSTYDVKLIAPRSCIANGCPNPPGYEIPTSTATLARQYTGPFNKLAMGINAGCELDPAGADGGTCKSTSTRSTKPWTYPQPNGTYKGFGNNVYHDRPILFGGVGNLSTGACCMNDASCSEKTGGDCQTAGGHFKGANTTCANTVCCPYPFADADHDGDVDQDDFGAFQVCYTGAAGGVPTGCSCFDRDGDGNITDLDFQAFNNCWTGSNVPWSAGLTPSCVP